MEERRRNLESARLAILLALAMRSCRLSVEETELQIFEKLEKLEKLEELEKLEKFWKLERLEKL